VGLFLRPRRPLLRLAAGAAGNGPMSLARGRSPTSDRALDAVDELGDKVIAEFEGERIKRFRQYWDEVGLLEGLGLLRED
jgi:hypothetical protein